MAEHIGIVIRNESDGSARVVADRTGACGGCSHKGGGCRGCLSGDSKIESRAKNPVGARVGDLVKIHLQSSNLFSGAALIYLLPIIGLMGGAFTGNWAAEVAGISSLIGALAGAFIGIAIGYAFLFNVDRDKRLRQRWMPTIKQIIQPAVGLPSGYLVTDKRASCCS